MISYKKHNDVFADENLQLVEIFEGKFKKGLMEGYCRHFKAQGENSLVEIGFFKEGQPNGKYTSIRLDGTIIEEGIKEKEKVVKSIPI
jgi:hypothetical protein